MGDRAQVIKHLKELQHIKLDGLRFRLIDAKGMIVGRLAIAISRILQGKDKPTYNPKHNMGDVVVVVNAAHVHFTNNQWDAKLYRYYTGYPGGLRETKASDQWDKDPTFILRNAVKGMLPSNRLRPYRLDKLKIFPDVDHPYKMLEMVPYVPSSRDVHVPGLGWPLPPGMKPMNESKYGFRASATREIREGAWHDAGTGLAGLDKLLTEEEKQVWKQQAGTVELGEAELSQQARQRQATGKGRPASKGS